MDLGLAGKVALVTGSGRGIGLETALALAGEGCRVVLCGRHREPLEAAAAAVSGRGAEALPVVADVTDPGAPPALLGATLDRWGRLDVLVNNVGGNRRKSFADTSDEDWEMVLELNLRCHARLTRHLLPTMIAQGGGSIVFVSSIFGREAGGAGLSLYNTTKAAMISLAKILSLEVAAHGVRVNSVAPGSLRFPGSSWDKRVQEDPEGMARFVQENIPLGRFGTPREVADVIAFLASERASLVTGACWSIDGGQSRSLI
ncbi:MAG TPA: SDR family NAD(P)-dependent oxidoreductase [Thermoanaerobaculia bacterium]|nr:SDR family NAD(P)-dependent oxidoreductase [Thermoanaerobaculia bacterium]